MNFLLCQYVIYGPVRIILTEDDGPVRIILTEDDGPVRIILTEEEVLRSI